MSFKESQAGKFYMGDRKNSKEDLLLPENQILVMAAKQKAEKETEEAGKLYLEAQKNKQKEIDEKLATLELLPMLDKIIISKYPENPYRKVMEGSIIVEYNGGFKNPDTGESDKLEEFVACARVIEVGPLSKYLKPGDDIFYDKRTVYPVPFMSMGYNLLSEGQVLCVLNDKLKERFKMSE